MHALPGAPVAAPLAWEELDEHGLHAQRWTLANIRDRLDDDDPWAGALDRGRSLSGAAKRLKALVSR